MSEKNVRVMRNCEHEERYCCGLFTVIASWKGTGQGENYREGTKTVSVTRFGGSDNKDTINARLGSREEAYELYRALKVYLESEGVIL